MQRIAFTPTRQHLPLPVARAAGHDFGETRRFMESSPASDGSDLQAERSRGKKMTFSLPSSKSARTVAGKANTVAGKASRAATKGASKMATAFKNFGRKGSKRAGTEDAEIIGAVEESADLLVDLEGMIDGVLDTAPDLDGTWEKAPNCGDAAGMQGSTPSTDRPGSPRQERSDFSSSSEPHNTSGSDSDVGHNRAPAREAKPPVRESLRPGRTSEVWDAQAYGKVRPLECQSIWDIPTSRIPAPPPRPPAPSGSSAQGQARKLPEIKISVAGDSECGLAEAESRRRCRHRKRIALLLCLAAALLISALAAARSLYT